MNDDRALLAKLRGAEIILFASSMSTFVVIEIIGTAADYVVMAVPVVVVTLPITGAGVWAEEINRSITSV